VSDDTRLVVSGPAGDLPGAWVEMPEAGYGMASKGRRPAPAVLPGAPAESPVRIRERGAPGNGSDAVLNHTGSRFSRLDPEPVAAGVKKGFHAVGLATRRLTARAGTLVEQLAAGRTAHPIWVWPGYPPGSLTDAMKSHGQAGGLSGDVPRPDPM
jgi:hypothetical protein